jgi:hypothetical protein
MDEIANLALLPVATVCPSRSLRAPARSPLPLDVHKASVTACVRLPGRGRGRAELVETFSHDDSRLTYAARPAAGPGCARRDGRDGRLLEAGLAATRRGFPPRPDRARRRAEATRRRTRSADRRGRPLAQPRACSFASPRLGDQATTGDVRRFRKAAGYAAHTGTAQVPASGGRVRRHRLNRGGNHRLNRALYTIATVQARWDPKARRYLKRKLEEGKSPAEARHCLKRHLSTLSTAPSSPMSKYPP